MEVITLTKKQFESLEIYQLPKDLFTAEGQLYVLPITNRWQTTTKLLKKFYTTSGTFFHNKLKVIKSLIAYKDTINIKEMVLPEKLVAVENEVVGYTMELVQSVDLETALSSDEISIERKIKYLRQIGEILEKMEHVRKYTELKDFYLNDIHEGNFIVDLKTDSIRVVDTDSCKINDNPASTIGSRYLQTGTIITHIPKYKIAENLAYGISYIPSRDTDLYCYIIMILNFIFGGDIEKLTIEELYDYLEYLHSIGVNPELISIFKKILLNIPNENPYRLLESLIPFYGRTHKNTYRCNKKR